MKTNRRIVKSYKRIHWQKPKPFPLLAEIFIIYVIISLSIRLLTT